VVPYHILVPLVLLCGFIVIQGLNASHAFSHVDEGLTPRNHLSFLPRSVSAGISFDALLRLLTYACVVGVVRSMSRSRIQHHVMVGTAILSGFCMALLVIMQRLDHPNPPYPMTGMFVNANSYAAYANLLFPMALVTGRSAHLRAVRRMRRSHPGYALYLVAAVLALSIVASGSRAGTAICAATLLCWFMLEIYQTFRGSARAGWWLIFSTLVPLLAAAVLFASLGDARFRTEFEAAGGITSGVAGRRSLLLACVTMFRDRWIAGSGAGTFECAFPYYQPSDLAGLYFKYAHNDFLEYAIELGVIGSLLLSGFLLTLFVPAWKEFRHINKVRRPLTRRYEMAGFALALGALLLHALVDFPMHIPGVVLVGCAWVGLAGQRVDHNW
jgi:O-antigen ligase